MRNLGYTIILVAVLLPCSFAIQAGDYALRDIDGKLQRVSEYRGRWLVINFWATWCPPCIHEMPELERFYQENRARASVWGVSFEDTDVELVREFVADLGVTYPILGLGQDPLTGYGKVRVLPTTFVIDPEGRFYHRFEGPITSHDIVDIIAR